MLVTVVPPNMWVTLHVPDGFEMRPSNETRERAFDSRRTVIVRVRDAAGRPVTGQAVHLTIAPSFTSGGHSHQRSQSQLRERPIGRIDGSTRVTTPASGEVMVTYVAPIVGGTETITATSIGAHAGEVSLSIAIPSIVTVPTSSAHYFIKPTSNHAPEDHYAQPGVIAVTDSLFSQWKALHALQPTTYPFIGVSGQFSIDALALPNGGLFDIAGNWRPSHFTHREGLDVDFNDVGNGGAERPEAQRLMRRLCQLMSYDGRPLECIYEGAATLGPHYHIYFPNRFSTRNSP